MNSFANLTGTRGMHVDDNADLLLMLSTVLENLTSAEIECYHSPQSALAAFIQSPDSYELIITDYEMPGMDGVELCRRLHSLAPTQKIFLATGSGFFTDTAARRAGFSALLNKPFPLSDLKAALAENFFGTEVKFSHDLIAA